MLKGRTNFKSLQIQSKSSESKSLMKPSKSLSSISLKAKRTEEEKEQKDAQKNREKPFNRATEDHGMAVPPSTVVLPGTAFTGRLP